MRRTAARAVKLVWLLGVPSWRRALRAGVAAAVEHAPMLREGAWRTVVDVGANRGQFALAARAVLPGARIFSLEPMEEAQAVWRGLFAEDAAATLIPVAAAAEAGEARFFLSRSPDCSSLLPIGEGQVRRFPGTGAAGCRHVQAARLDGVLAMADLVPPVLLKIDVQGAEREVLEGAGDLLSAIRDVWVEASFEALYDGQALAGEVAGWLGARGFRLTAVRNPVTVSGGVVQADLCFRREGGA
ncbi:FkbM family methyltransferase [Futiania mangrovi]|uniref:FkbM family methyltransferase n=1 Tax=Futiania mangrovi TaxID=2959716 RepID=A0A9J6PFH1_9PROT|nr:FkbM family methyltransferase [Futiania mangrovii]MCP1335367.1 FkbM family methyltransferase [Futiania mangrovii]